MKHVGKCPSCEKPIRHVLIETLMARTQILSDDHAYFSVMYLCPSCRCVLSVQMDPLRVGKLTAEGAARKIRGG